MMKIILDLATLAGLASSAIGMTGILCAKNDAIRTLGEITVATGIATIVASGLSAGA